MNTNNTIKGFSHFTLFITLFLFLPVFSYAADSLSVSSSNDSSLMIQGKVRSFNQDTQMITLKTSEGERVNIFVNWNTTVVGYGSPLEIAKDQGIKVWYTVEENKKIANKVERKMDLGC